MVFQHRTYCKFSRIAIKNGEETKSEILVFHFYLGPIRFGCIVNIPRNGRDSAPVYIQLSFPTPSKSRDWTVIDEDEAER